jgi:hypothetical protein
MSFAPIRDEKEDVVKSGALRLTWVSGAIGGVGAILTVFNEQFINLFGENASDGIKASVLIAIIAAWTLIAVADILGRSMTVSARLRRAPDESMPAPKGMRVKLTEGEDAVGWTVAAIRSANGGDTSSLEFLVTKAGEAPQWIKQEGVIFAS